jgi:hypothetical protein
MAQDITEQYNLSFEADEVGYEGIPQQWTFQRSPTISYKITDECREGAVGKKCLMVDYSNSIEGDSSRTFMSNFIEIDSTKKYTCSFWLKTEELTPRKFGVSVGVLYFDGNKNPIAPEVYENRYQVKNNGCTEWTLFSQDLSPQAGVPTNDFKPNQIPSNARYARLFFLSYGYDRKYWIDDFRFESVSSSFGAFEQKKIRIARAAAIKEIVFH